MTPTDLRTLIQEGEGTTLEFKENLSPSFARGLVAMANTIGGKILLGVRDDEKAGTGIKRIRDEARAQGCPEPVFEETGFVTATFYPNPEVRVHLAAPSDAATEQVGAHVPHMYRTSPRQVALLEAAKEARSREELQEVIGVRHRQHFLLEYLRPLLDAGWLERTIPDKPRSRDQRYRITPHGLEVLKKSKETK